MRRFWFLASVFAWSLLFLSGCTADEWQTVSAGGDESYLVAIPQGAQGPASESATFTAAGEQVVVALAGYRHEAAVYTVAHAPLGDEIEEAEAIDSFLDDVHRWLVEESGYRPRHPAISALSWNGYPGRVYRFALGDEGPATKGRAQIILAEEDLYLLLITGPEQVVNDRADKFLASFDLRED